MSKDWMSVRIPSELAEEIRAEAKDKHTTITKILEGRLSVKVVDITDDVQGSDGQATATSVAQEPASGPCAHLNTRQAATGIICMDCRAVLKR